MKDKSYLVSMTLSTSLCCSMDIFGRAMTIGRKVVAVTGARFQHRRAQLRASHVRWHAAYAHLMLVEVVRFRSLVRPDAATAITLTGVIKRPSQFPRGKLHHNATGVLKDGSPTLVPTLLTAATIHSTHTSAVQMTQLALAVQRTLLHIQMLAVMPSTTRTHA